MKIEKIIPQYLQYMKTINRSYYTIRSARYNLRDLSVFLAEEDIFNIEKLSSEVLTEYQQDLAFRLTSKGTLLGLKTQEKRLCDLKAFTRFLLEQDYLPFDPGSRIKLPKQQKKLPRCILDQGEVRRLMKAPDIRTNLGYRNRIILEILYDTGIRRAEMACIKIQDIDHDAGYILIRGKGEKDRVVPLSQRVCTLIRNYLLAVRPVLFTGKDQGWLIVNKKGRRMNLNSIWRIVKESVVLAGIKKNITTHTFRHTCATHMLKNGASIRHIQEMLGHESLESTEIYTHVTINDLKAVHAKYHPGENMYKRGRK